MKNYIIIYGAGRFGKALYQFFKSMNVAVDFFCQTKCDEEKCYGGIPVISQAKLLEMNNEMSVFIAIADMGISKLIKNQLLNANRIDIHIYESGTFIIQNRLDRFDQDVCYCNVCGSWVKGFGERSFAMSDLYIEHRVSGGGGKRDNEVCPICQSLARIRWQYWVLGKYTNIFTDRCNVLHIAPEMHIRERIQENELCDYYMGEIRRYEVKMHTIDATNIQFKDNYFDYIIMNHVLEHIENEEKAIVELRRVLKKNTGKLILSFPICMDIDTYENTDAKTPEERIKEFGQRDHVRLYGRDYKIRLEKYGFSIETYSPQDKCSAGEITKYGLDYDDVISICTY